MNCQPRTNQRSKWKIGKRREKKEAHNDNDNNNNNNSDNDNDNDNDNDSDSDSDNNNNNIVGTKVPSLTKSYHWKHCIEKDKNKSYVCLSVCPFLKEQLSRMVYLSCITLSIMQGLIIKMNCIDKSKLIQTMELWWMSV